MVAMFQYDNVIPSVSGDKRRAFTAILVREGEGEVSVFVLRWSAAAQHIGYISSDIP